MSKADDLIRRAMSELGKRSAKKRTSKDQSRAAKARWDKWREVNGKQKPENK